MIDRQAKSFPHRRNSDGTCDSICPVYFRTIARHLPESELAAYESDHSCDADTLAYLTPARTKISFADNS